MTVREVRTDSVDERAEAIPDSLSESVRFWEFSKKKAAPRRISAPTDRRIRKERREVLKEARKNREKERLRPKKKTPDRGPNGTEGLPFGRVCRRGQ
jgi:hypothetical protein